MDFFLIYVSPLINIEFVLSSAITFPTIDTSCFKLFIGFI
ncbi:putative membrane protein, partial [Yersinia pestis PY-90]